MWFYIGVFVGGLITAYLVTKDDPIDEMEDYKDLTPPC